MAQSFRDAARKELTWVKFVPIGRDRWARSRPQIDPWDNSQSAHLVPVISGGACPSPPVRAVSKAAPATLTPIPSRRRFYTRATQRRREWKDNMTRLFGSVFLVTIVAAFVSAAQPAMAGQRTANRWAADSWTGDRWAVADSWCLQGQD